MKDTLQRQLDMIWRTENPNYLIIVKNKAGKDMNFNNFQIVAGEEQPGDKLPDVRFVIGIDPIFSNKEDFIGKGTIMVKEEGRIVFRTETKSINLKKWIRKLKLQYKPNAVYYEPKRSSNI